MKKKLLSILIVTLSVLSLTGCVDREEELDDMLDECMDYAEEGDGAMAKELYDEAMDYYRKALDVQKEPPMLDPLQAMAQLCEIRGDFPGALAARREEADRIKNQWHITGEELDMVLRDIQRLEKKLNK